MKFTLNRDFTFASTLGAAVGFKEGVPVHVPPALYAEVQAIGAVPEKEIPAEAKTAEDGAPTDPAAREEALFKVFEKLVLENERSNFTAGGTPHATALNKELGWVVPNKERDVAWAKFKTKE
jgi:hypothetical protein